MARTSGAADGCLGGAPSGYGRFMPMVVIVMAYFLL